MSNRKIPHQLHITRDLVLFAVGVFGIIYETVVSTQDRPGLLALFSGMVGLPVFLRFDSKDKEDSDE